MTQFASANLVFKEVVDLTILFMLNVMSLVPIRKPHIFIFGVGMYIAALEHCRKMKFKIQLHLTLINKNYNLRLEWFCGEGSVAGKGYIS